MMVSKPRLGVLTGRKGKSVTAEQTDNGDHDCKLFLANINFCHKTETFGFGVLRFHSVGLRLTMLLLVSGVMDRPRITILVHMCRLSSSHDPCA